MSSVFEFPTVPDAFGLGGLNHFDELIVYLSWDTKQSRRNHNGAELRHYKVIDVEGCYENVASCIKHFVFCLLAIIPL